MRRKLVSAPAVTPSAYTLLDYVQWRDDPDPHWQAGITWQQVCGDTSTTIDWCVITGGDQENPTKSATAALETRGAMPFTILAEIDCSPVGFWDSAEDNVRGILTRMESTTLESVLWTGTAAGIAELIKPHLAENTEVVLVEDGYTQVLMQPAMTVPVTGTLDVVEALGALEYALENCYGGVGIVHVTIPVFEMMISQYLLTKSGARWQTAKGNWVVPGGGYPGTAPDGSAPAYGVNWMYITGAVFGYRSGIKLNGTKIEHFDRSVNTLKVIAERTYVLGWDCCQFGVAVSYGGIITGLPNSAT